MTRGNPSDLQSFDSEIDRTFHRLVRHHFVPFQHPEHSVIGEYINLFPTYVTTLKIKHN